MKHVHTAALPSHSRAALACQSHLQDRWYWWGGYEILRRVMQTAGIVIMTIATRDPSFEVPFGCFIAWLSLALHCFGTCAQRACICAPTHLSAR